MKLRKERFNRHIESLWTLKETERRWHFPSLAGLCVGLCLAVGQILGEPLFGNIASFGALVILYFTHDTLEKRMVHISVCAMGLVMAFSLQLLFSFHVIPSLICFFVVTFLSHFLTSYFDIPPPRNFFFIMAAAVATQIPFDVQAIPAQIGMFTFGAMVSVLLAFFYSVFVAKEIRSYLRIKPRKNRYTKTVESVVLGLAMVLALIVGYAVDKESPYWVPVSALAVLQGKDLLHTTERNLHRVLGTFLGMGIAWVILSLKLSPWIMVLTIALQQAIIELLVVRNYLFAVLFITPLTILLAETGRGVNIDPSALIYARVIDTFLGAIIGLLTGYILHNKSVVSAMEKGLRQVRILRKKQFHPVRNSRNDS